VETKQVSGGEEMITKEIGITELVNQYPKAGQLLMASGMG